MRKNLADWQHRFAVRLGFVTLLAAGFNVFFGCLFFLAERSTQESLTLLDSLWWAMVTMTTVGYGDVYPHTTLGRFIISYPSMLLGIGLIGYLIGLATEYMVERFSRRRKGTMNISYRDHIIICHYPGKAKLLHLVSELEACADLGQKRFVLIDDSLDELDSSIRARGIDFVKGQPIHEGSLRKANIMKCAGILILAQSSADKKSDPVSFTTVAIVQSIKKEHNLTCKVVVEVVGQENYNMVDRLRPDGMVTAEGISDCLMVQEFLYPGIHKIIQQIVSNEVGSQFYIFDTKLHSHRIKDVQIAVIEHPNNLQVIGIMKGNKQILNPSKDMTIEKGDQIIVLAESKADYESIEDSILEGN